MVFISMENLERMQRMQKSATIENIIAMTDNSTKNNTKISNAENVNNFVTGLFIVIRCGCAYS